MLEGKEKIQVIIKEYREAAALTRQIIPVIQKYNNKCFNKRLQESLQAETKSRVYCGKRYSFFEIYIYHGHSNQQITLCYIPVEKAFTDGKRINAAAIVESINKKYSDLLSEAYELENKLPLIDQYKKELEYLKQQIDNITATIPNQIQDACRLYYRVRNY